MACRPNLYTCVPTPRHIDAPRSTHNRICVYLFAALHTNIVAFLHVYTCTYPRHHDNTATQLDRCICIPTCALLCVIVYRGTPCICGTTVCVYPHLHLDAFLPLYGSRLRIGISTSKYQRLCTTVCLFTYRTVLVLACLCTYVPTCRHSCKPTHRLSYEATFLFTYTLMSNSRCMYMHLRRIGATGVWRHIQILPQSARMLSRMTVALFTHLVCVCMWWHV